MAIVSDERWREILAAAAPHVPSATAGTEIERALAEYFEEIIDPKKLLAERAREKRIVDLASKLKTALYWRRRQVPWPKHDPEQPLRDLQAVTSVLWRHQQIFDHLDILVHERKRRGDPARARLVLRLLDIWIDHFAGKLAVTQADGPRCSIWPAGALRAGGNARRAQAADQPAYHQRLCGPQKTRPPATQRPQAN